MLRNKVKPDPAIVSVALVAGVVAVIVGAGFWALIVAGAALGAGVLTMQLWALATTVRHMDSLEQSLVRRARSAAGTARRLNRSAPAGPIAERFRAAEPLLEASAASTARLIQRAMAVRQLRSGIDQGAAGRVNAVILELRGRAQSQVESLESVVARQIEVLALADVDPSGDALAALERLGAEVDALRAGLDEAQRLGGATPLTEFSEERK